MNLSLHKTLARRTQELAVWQWGATGLLVLSAVVNGAYTAALMDARAQLRDQAVQLQQAQDIRDMAVQRLGELTLQAEQEASAESVVCEPEEPYTYIGECVITAYCPCEECCGQWADGLTATGVPAVPGIVAVDPKVIPLGSTVVIGGQRYLAADTGVTGLAVDVCVAGHQEAVERGVWTVDVWVVAE